ncbi:M15 family metallopeptidase [Mycobacterium sp. WMMD1722]|uniref:M15 family metallopeptidase n=1 Tax=Mycobacterium sp. WMMD1722 TaxID=3404117 RepID=UPI003BF4D14A
MARRHITSLSTASRRGTRGRAAKFAAVAVLSVAVVANSVACVPPAPEPPAPDPSARPLSPPPAPPSVAAATPPSQPPATIGARVTWVTAADLGATWRPGCPVGPEELRRVETTYLGFDGQTHRGALVVHEDLVAEVIDLLEQLHAQRYAIARMRTVDEYPGAEDELSMADNNTSAFNCRGIPGSSRWSEHAYGRAIDLNPLLNPSVDSAGKIEPANAGPYVDRSRTDPGMLHAGDPVVELFTSRGWRWGGHWRTPKDYQHFERP